MMNWRSLHRWFSLFVSLPLAVMLFTGSLLATRAFNPWLQPKYESSSRRGLEISFSELLEIVKKQREPEINSWSDIAQIDVRPDQGEIRVRAKFNHWEVVVDAATGRVLGVGKRRVGWFMSLHQGALFGDGMRYGVFLPSAVGALLLLLSGVWLLIQAVRARFMRQKN